MNICATLPISKESLDLILLKTGQEVKIGSMFDQSMRDIFKSAEILICRDKEININLLPEMKKLKWVYNIGVGVDRLPFETFIKQGIRVTNAANLSNDAMSDYVIGAMMLFSCNFLDMIHCQENHYWKPYVYTKTLSNQTVLIVGAGKIGTSVARKTKFLGMNVFGICNNKYEDSNYDYLGSINELKLLCRNADFVVSILPLTPQTEGLFDSSVFLSMKRTSVFINISRGKLVNTNALIDSLNNGLIRGAVIDTFANEPLNKDDPLWDATNIVITPHSAGRIEGFVDKAIIQFIDNYNLYISNGKLLNEIDLEKRY